MRKEKHITMRKGKDGKTNEKGTEKNERKQDINKLKMTGEGGKESRMNGKARMRKAGGFHLAEFCLGFDRKALLKLNKDD